MGDTGGISGSFGVTGGFEGSQVRSVGQGRAQERRQGIGSSLKPLPCVRGCRGGFKGMLEPFQDVSKVFQRV